MLQSVSILVGTMTGTAELVANDVKAALEQRGHKVEVLVMDNLTAEVFKRPGAFLICTSTYGQGDVPDNARAFFDDLKARRPNLKGRQFGVIGLGDATYADTFNQGGRQFDDLLAQLGAERVMERLQHNASSEALAEVAGVAWATGWAGRLRPVAAAAR